MTPYSTAFEHRPDATGASDAAVAPVARACLSRRSLLALSGAALLGLGLAGCSAAPSDGGADAGEGAAAGADDPAGAGDASVAEGTSGDADSAEAAGAAEEPASGTTFAFNTLVSIQAYGVDQDVVTERMRECARYDGLFSARTEGSDIYRINEAHGEPVEVDPDTADLLAQSLEYCALSDGTFDITIGAVSLLWDFSEGVKPADDAIADAVRHVDYTCVQVDGTTVTLSDPDAKIDLGGIAKGWIADRLCDRLVEAGATAALISLGTSSTYVLGHKPDGAPWRIGMRDPMGESTASISAVVELADVALTSSGLYDQQFELDGTTYWHILDPATGYPAQTDMLGVAVVTPTAVQGDAFSTMLFIKGIEEGSAWLAENYPDVAARFIGEDDGAVLLNGFEDYGYEEVEPSDG